MIIILNDDLGGELKIETEHNDPDKKINPVVTGDAKYTFIKEVDASYGHYGHTISLDNTSNLDLSVACRKLPSFKFISATPEIKPTPLPDGFVS
jgi:hypothetical protein